MLCLFALLHGAPIYALHLPIRRAYGHLTRETEKSENYNATPTFGSTESTRNVNLLENDVEFGLEGVKHHQSVFILQLRTIVESICKFHLCRIELEVPHVCVDTERT